MINNDFMNKENTNFARGVAIFMIIACHVAAFVFQTKIARLLTPLGGIGVAVFLIISGYGNNESYLHRGLKDFWKRKILGVLIPYFAIFPLYALLNGQLVILGGDFFKSLFTIESTYYWYIGYQLLWYAVFYPAVRFKKSLALKYTVLGIMAIISFVLFNEIRAEQSISFLLGVILSDFKEIKNKIQNIYVAIGALIVGVGCLAVKQIPVIREIGGILMNLVQLGIKLPLGIFILLAVSWVMSKDFAKVLKKPLTVMGDSSYSLYLSHSACLMLITIIASAISIWLGVICFFVATFVLTVILNVFTKQLNKCIKIK